MDKNNLRASEEDIRTKVVYSWLVNHGFSPADISVEFSFELRFGHGICRIDGKPIKQSSKGTVFRPRADVLVRTSHGRNLMIVEV